MPMVSQAQWRYLFATDKPFAREWARETPGGKGKRHRRLQARVAKKATRITGNLFRANDGKFSSGGDNPASDAAAASDSPEPKKPSARAQNAAARRERAAAESETRAAEADAEQAVRDEEDAKLDKATKPAERAKLRREIAKARRERAAELRKARAERSAVERQARADEDAGAAAANAPKDPKAKPEKPKKGGGGGGKAGEDPAKAAAAEDRKREQEARRAEVAARRAEADKRRAEADARRAEAEQRRQANEAERGERQQRELTDLATRAQTPGMRLTDSQWERLVVEGLAERDGTVIRLTPAGQQQAARKPAAKDAHSDWDETPGEMMEDGPRRPPTRRDMARERARMAARLTPSEFATASLLGLVPPREKDAAPLLRVFKDAQGQDRWLTITTTAYEDRDAEIITTKGIAFAAAYGDTTGERGVLRFWHVPGLDLGTCDYQAQGGPGGRWLVESGTFYGPREAAIGRAMAAKGWHMSPGFLHPRDEPYPAEVGGRRVALYDHPMIFERSPTPPGRASNLFGRFATTKEHGMNEEKRAALKELVGGDDALLADLLGRIEQTDKAAQDAGVAFKDAPPWAQALVTLVEQQGARLAALEATTKAPMDPAEMIAAGTTEAEDGAADEMEDAAEGEDNLLSPGEVQAIAAAVAAELMGKLDGIAAKMAEVDNELKGRGYQRMKEFPAALDALAKSLKAIETTVNELNGLRPARGYRASEDADDLPAELAAMLKGEIASSDPLDSVIAALHPAP